MSVSWETLMFWDTLSVKTCQTEIRCAIVVEAASRAIEVANWQLAKSKLGLSGWVKTLLWTHLKTLQQSKECFVCKNPTSKAHIAYVYSSCPGWSLGWANSHPQMTVDQALKQAASIKIHLRNTLYCNCSTELDLSPVAEIFIHKKAIYGWAVKPQLKSGRQNVLLNRGLAKMLQGQVSRCFNSRIIGSKPRNSIAPR